MPLVNDTASHICDMCNQKYLICKCIRKMYATYISKYLKRCNNKPWDGIPQYFYAKG
jgi:hypothetical protein